MIHFTRELTDPYPIFARDEDMGPSILQEWRETDEGPVVEYVCGVDYATLGICELFDMKPVELEARAIALGWFKRTGAGLEVVKYEYCGLYHDPDRPRPGNMADAYFTPAAVEVLSGERP